MLKPDEKFVLNIQSTSHKWTVGIACSFAVVLGLVFHVTENMAFDNRLWSSSSQTMSSQKEVQPLRRMRLGGNVQVGHVLPPMKAQPRQSVFEQYHVWQD